MSTKNPAAPSTGLPTSSTGPAGTGTTPSLESLQAAAAAAGSNSPLNSLNPEQLIALLRHLPAAFSKLAEQGNMKEVAAETLSNLSQAAHQSSQQSSEPFNQNIHPQLQQQPGQDPGPNTHPNGPPMLGQPSQGNGDGAGPSLPMHRNWDGGDAGKIGWEGYTGNTVKPQQRGSKKDGAAMNGEEWSRQRKDNHKEVERRRRGNINEGINELARIVPNGTGEKAKGAILSRSVQYIHHLKENEARNIEKWTLEKLLMDQAMGDLQAQLDEVRRGWAEEERARKAVEAELAVLRARLGKEGGEGEGDGEQGDGERDAEGETRSSKRQRTE